MSNLEPPIPSRPQMPASYGLEPIATGATLPWSYVTDRMTGSRNYWIGTTRPDGRPHAVPVWGIWLDGALVFATDTDSQKSRNLKANPNVVAHLESGDDVLIIEGKAEEITDQTLLARFVDAYEVKYNLRPEVTGSGIAVYRVQCRVVLAWQEADFPKTATRWAFGPE